MRIALRLALVVAIAVGVGSLASRVWGQPAADCLSPTAVTALLEDRGGLSWVYAPADRDGLRAARCVSRRGARISYRAADGQDRALEWIGAAQSGHWYRFRRVGTWFERYADRNDAKLPPVTAIYAALAPTDDETLMIVRLVPPVKRIDVPWTIEYQAYLKPTADPALPTAWTSSTRGLDYRPAPRRGAGGTIEALYGWNSGSMSAADAETFHRRYSAAVMDFIDARFFDGTFPVSLMEVNVLGMGPTAVRAGVTAVSPQNGVRPPEAVGSLGPEAPLFAFVHVMMGRAIERDLTLTHRIRVTRDGTSVSQFTSTPEDWKRGWTEYWVQHALPQGRFPAGTYALDWQFGSTSAATIPFTVSPR